MKTVIIGIVLICVVNVVVGEGTTEEVCESPIDVNQKDSTCGDGEGRPVVNFGDAFNGVVTYNGNWESLGKVSLPAGSTITVFIGNREYSFEEFHFHLGKDPTQGSQHTQDGKYHDMEMHIPMVTIDGKSQSVLGFFVDAREGEDNPEFASLTNALKNLKKADDSEEVKINLREMVAPAFEKAFYQYNGTNQLPPCGVMIPWTIYQTPLLISKSQLDAFRDTGVTSNFRPLYSPLKDKLYNSAPC